MLGRTDRVEPATRTLNLPLHRSLFIIMASHLNIACGTTYIRHSDWHNVDYTCDSEWVVRSNLLNGLETPGKQYLGLYCSHFLEHVPFSAAEQFLRNCRALMGEKSVLRIVVPDMEFLANEYLNLVKSGETEKAEFCQVCLLDQCVRQTSGGRLAEYIQRIGSGDLRHLRDYAEYLLGPELFLEDTKGGEKASAWRRAFKNPTAIVQKAEKAYIGLLCSMLPEAFRQQNVSFTAIGERHQWVYDFQSLRAMMSKVGFSTVIRQSFDRSALGGNVFTPLDLIGTVPRKGHHQLFVEAML